MSKKWLYGESWERYPIEAGQVWGLLDGSRVAVHNIFDSFPSWMRSDLIFVDPPWNLGNLNTFYTKAERSDYLNSFTAFADVLFQRIADIGARTTYIEIGNQNVDNWQERLSAMFPYMQRWPVTYYGKHPTNLLRGSHIAPTGDDYTGIDEARCIEMIAASENYRVIADPCMGRGLVGLAAYRAGKPFVGTELNKRRLAVLLDKLAQAGARVERLS